MEECIKLNILVQIYVYFLNMISIDNEKRISGINGNYIIW